MYLKIRELVVQVIGEVPVTSEYIYDFCIIALFLIIIYCVFIFPWKEIFKR